MIRTPKDRSRRALHFEWHLILPPYPPPIKKFIFTAGPLTDTNFSIFLKIFHISFLSPIQKLFQYDQILSKTHSHVRKLNKIIFQISNRSPLTHKNSLPPLRNSVITSARKSFSPSVFSVFNPA